MFATRPKAFPLLFPWFAFAMFFHLSIYWCGSWPVYRTVVLDITSSEGEFVPGYEMGTLVALLASADTRVI